MLYVFGIIGMGISIYTGKRLFDSLERDMIKIINEREKRY